MAAARSHFQFSFSEFNGGWPIILKFAESAVWHNHQFFPMHLKFLIQSHSVSSLFENFHWSFKVPLSCNVVGYLLAIKIRGHEFNLPWDGFWAKLHSLNFSVPFTDGNWLRRLYNERSHFSLLLLRTKFVSSVEGFFSTFFLFFSCAFFVNLRESSFNMTSGGDEDIEGRRALKIS